MCGIFPNTPILVIVISTLYELTIASQILDSSPQSSPPLLSHFEVLYFYTWIFYPLWNLNFTCPALSISHPSGSLFILISLKLLVYGSASLSHIQHPPNIYSLKRSDFIFWYCITLWIPSTTYPASTSI